MKRVVCLILIIALLAAVGSPVLGVDIWFIAVDDTIPMTLTGGSVPFYYGSALYVPYGAFDAAALNVFSIYDSGQNLLAMYNIDHRLTFDLSAGTVTDLGGNSSDVSALSRGGTVYVPVYYVASHFGLGCDLLEGSGGYPIIRLTSGNEIYDNDKFVTQSANLVDSRVSQYQSEPPEVSAAVSPPVTVTPSPSPDAQVSPSPEVTEEPVEPVTVPDVMLFLPGKSFEDIKDSLGGANAVFTYTLEELRGSDDQVRSIIAQGYQIAMELSSDSQRRAMSEARQFNELLDSMTQSKTMLIMSRNEYGDVLQELIDAGFVVWDNVTVAGEDFNITAYEGYLSIFVPQPQSEAIQDFVEYMGLLGASLLPMRLTTEPF